MTQASSIPSFDQASAKRMQAILDNKTKPLGSLGRLEELAVALAGITASTQLDFGSKAIVLAAADHGVARKGVSLYPSEVTRQMVLNFMAGGAAVNVLARHAGAKVVVVDAGVAGGSFAPMPGFYDRKQGGGQGSADLSAGPAMTFEQAKACLAAGAEVVADLAKQGVKMVGLGEMGIGNTTPSSAIAAVVMELAVEEVTGRGTGLDVEAWQKKVAVIQQAIAVNRPDPQDGMDLLVKVGGFEIGVLAGVILEAAKRRMPVMLDGFISGAAALVAYRIDPACKHYLLAGHQSVEIGHRRIHEFLGLKPLLQLDLRLGEGTGAAMAFTVVDAACKIVAEMATFDSAGVSQEKSGKDAFDTKEA